MAKYLLLWEMDLAKVPIDPRERAKAWLPFAETVKGDMGKGICKDWGSFLGELRGYAIVEGTETEIEQLTDQYIPFVIFKTHAVISLEQDVTLIRDYSK